MWNARRLLNGTLSLLRCCNSRAHSALTCFRDSNRLVRAVVYWIWKTSWSRIRYCRWVRLCSCCSAILVMAGGRTISLPKRMLARVWNSRNMRYFASTSSGFCRLSFPWFSCWVTCKNLLRVCTTRYLNNFLVDGLSCRPRCRHHLFTVHLVLLLFVGMFIKVSSFIQSFV